MYSNTLWLNWWRQEAVTEPWTPSTFDTVSRSGAGGGLEWRRTIDFGVTVSSEKRSSLPWYCDRNVFFCIFCIDHAAFFAWFISRQKIIKDGHLFSVPTLSYLFTFLYLKLSWIWQTYMEKEIDAFQAQILRLALGSYAHAISCPILLLLCFVRAGLLTGCGYVVFLSLFACTLAQAASF